MTNSDYRNDPHSRSDFVDYTILTDTDAIHVLISVNRLDTYREWIFLQ